MPYIKQQDRDGWNAAMLELTYRIQRSAGRPGTLNYVITRLVKYWLGDAPDYAAFNAALGVLEAVKLELYRRMVAPYEDVKCHENGDVY